MVRKAAATLVAMVLVACLMGAAYAGPLPLVLEFKGEPGQEMKRDVEVSFEMDMSAMNPETGEQVFALDPRFSATLVTIDRVTEVAENGDLTLQSQVESLDVTLDFADLHMDLSLQGPDGGPPQLIKLPALPIEVVMSKHGKPLALKGLDKLPLPPMPAGPEGEQFDIKAMIEGMMETFAQPTLPDAPVSVGDSWGWEAEIDLGKMMGNIVPDIPPEATAMLSSMKIPVKTTTTFEGLETMGGVECAKLVADTVWELEFPAGPGIMLEESGTTTVVTWFNHAAGHSVKEVVEVDVDMRAGTPDVAVMQMEMEIRGESMLR
jgi:hypothetical protein